MESYSGSFDEVSQLRQNILGEQSALVAQRCDVLTYCLIRAPEMLADRGHDWAPASGPACCKTSSSSCTTDICGLRATATKIPWVTDLALTAISVPPFQVILSEIARLYIRLFPTVSSPVLLVGGEAT